MCGIVGGICPSGISRPLLLGLSRLEYRGYDSAGIAVSGGGNGDGNDVRRRVVVGRVGKLRQAAEGLDGVVGIAHTRWATHGAPSEVNAHPIRAGRVFVVHNGIIENHAELRAEAEAAGGGKLSGGTDTEVAARLLDMEYKKSGDLLDALRAVRRRLRGAYALAAMAEGTAEIVCIRQGNPLLAGSGESGIFIASAPQALSGEATRAHYFLDGQYARLSNGKMELWNGDDSPATCAWTPLSVLPEEVQLGEYRHFMQKEIFAQPDAVAATMENRATGGNLSPRRFGTGTAVMFRRVRRVVIVACGTSYHAGLVARRWMERFNIPCRADIASEYRHCPDSLSASSLCVAVSQSGETADTLSAMRAAKASGAATLALVNVENSTLAREADFVFCTRAGVEIAVASTKAFTSQLTGLLLLTLAMAKARHTLPADDEAEHLRRLRQLPYLLSKSLLLESAVKEWADEFAPATSVVYIGRGAHYPLALEGALKLKEISYIHAEGVAAGELKHGPLALIDAAVPVVGLVPDNALRDKMAANLAEVAARDGRLFVIGGRQFSMENVRIARCADDGGELLSPIVYAPPLQLLAYHVARRKGTDIDKPRNLAKSVTVE